MREYASGQAALRLRRLAFQLNSVLHAADAEEIRLLRTAIRRLSRCLKCFAPLYPEASTKPILKRLERLMDAAGAVRDLDIAAGLISGAGLEPGDALLQELAADRARALHELREHAAEAHAAGYSKKWRRKLRI
jgi:CHAD domain-containing protein